MKKIISTTLLTLLASTALAQNAALVVAPTRLVIQEGQRTAEAALTNVSDRTIRYRINLVDHIMTASGTTLISDSFAYSAKPMLRYMPRVVELEPGKRQTIRLMVTRPDGLAAGDYHTHMLFDEISMPVSATDATPRTDNTVSMKVEMSYSMGIPVVVQTGRVSSSVALQSASLVKDTEGHTQALQVTLNRSGNAEGNIMLSGKLPNGAEAFSPRRVRIYRERDSITPLIQLAPEAAAANPQEVTLQLRSIDDKQSLHTQTVR